MNKNRLKKLEDKIKGDYMQYNFVSENGKHQILETGQIVDETEIQKIFNSLREYKKSFVMWFSDEPLPELKTYRTHVLQCDMQDLGLI